MSIFNLLFGSNASDDDTNSDDDAYMYRLENDGDYTPVSKSDYKAHTDQLFRDGYYDDVPLDDEPKKKWWQL